MSTTGDDSDRDADAVDEPTEASSGPDEAEQSFDVMDEMYEAFGDAPSAYIGGHYTTNEEELPKPAVDDVLADAHVPPFLKENQICIEDSTEYVLRDRWNEVLARFEPAVVDRSLGGEARVSNAQALDALGTRKPEDMSPRIAMITFAIWMLVVGAFMAFFLQEERDALRAVAAGVPAVLSLGLLLVAFRFCRPITASEILKREGIEERGGYVAVEPKRPVCRHYVRQLYPPAPSEFRAGTVKKGWLRRYCSARRTVAGAFMDLTDRDIKACSIREPYDVASDELIRDFDQSLEEKSRAREHLPMFQLATQHLFGKDSNGGKRRQTKYER